MHFLVSVIFHHLATPLISHFVCLIAPNTQLFFITLFFSLALRFVHFELHFFRQLGASKYFRVISFELRKKWRAKIKTKIKWMKTAFNNNHKVHGGSLLLVFCSRIRKVETKMIQYYFSSWLCCFFFSPACCLLLL